MNVGEIGDVIGSTEQGGNQGIGFWLFRLDDTAVIVAKRIFFPVRTLSVQVQLEVSKEGMA